MLLVNGWMGEFLSGPTPSNRIFGFQKVAIDQWAPAFGKEMHIIELDQ